ncbi:MAG TPA: nicotinate-nucleotide adenylyltransferase [Verrucomicrobiae bacterium]|jgi:nicotinate-nucleotide adenylyltransferase
MKVGIYGGTFDPVHLGHLQVAQAAIEELGLDRLFFVPAGQSPFKAENVITSSAVRLQLLRLALAGRTNCEIDEQEIRRGGTSYAIDTVRDYANRFSGAQLFYVIGADNISRLNEWKDAAALAGLVEFAAVPRPGSVPAPFPQPFRGRVLKGPLVDISSSEIRERIKAGLPIGQLVPADVGEFIRNNGLYL